jgi:hypothetical protein
MFTGRGVDTDKVLDETTEGWLDVRHAKQALELPLFEFLALSGLLRLGWRLAGQYKDLQDGRGDVACLDEMLGFFASLFSLGLGFVGAATSWGLGLW